ncbi:MAG: ABC transporter permease [Verrucomicrobia bacterium]|nr:ABC transporter permease [Verrucomicrobiota bacterium]
MSVPGKTGVVMLALVLAAALLAGVIGRHGPLEQPFRDRMLAPPSLAHPFGVDGAGRDVLTRVLHGTRLTLGVAGAAAALSLVAGVVLGAWAAMRGGWTDLMVSRATDALISFPPLLIGLFLLAVLGPSPRSVALAVGVAGVPAMVRQVRAAFLAERAQEYVLAAQALGAGRWRIAAGQILPNCAGIILVTATLQFGGAILEAAGFSFLGLSGQPDAPEWGNMLRQEYAVFRTAPHLVIVPGAAIAWTVLACNLAGDALRDWFAPRRHGGSRA